MREFLNLINYIKTIKITSMEKVEVATTFKVFIDKLQKKGGAESVRTRVGRITKPLENKNLENKKKLIQFVTEYLGEGEDERMKMRMKVRMKVREGDEVRMKVRD